ncbi:MAG: cysteine hydrolase family protein [Cyclobacteriaceae bacterium]
MKAYPYLLLIIDAQQGIDMQAYWGGHRNNPQAEQHIARLLTCFRKQAWPVIHVQHCSRDSHSPLFPGQPGHAFMPSNQPASGETIVEKTETNAFIRTGLQAKITESRASHVVITGFVTNNSVEATARMCGNLGFNTIVVSDATAAFDKVGLDGETYPAALVHGLSLANLSGEYAEVLTTQTLIDNMEARA